MAQNIPSYLLNPTTVAARAAEYDDPNLDFAGGMNKGGSCTCGVGIGTNVINPKLDDWTVIDQGGSGRAPQNSQHIGGSGLATADSINTPILAIQGADINDTFSFITAIVQAAPGAGMGSGGSDPVNRSDQTVEIGDRAWGTNTV